VVSVAPGLELVVRGTLLDGLLLPTLFIPLGVSAQLAFASDGSLLAGFGAAGGPFKFAAFAKDLSITAVKLPAGWGFPLAH
jgi:hypothetical protein